MSAFGKYFVRLVGLTALIAAVAAALFLTILKPYYNNAFPILLTVVFLITLVEHLFLTKALKGRPNKFSVVFMAASAIKLLAFLLVLVLYFLINKDQIISFVAIVFVLYVLYTWFEVRVLLKLVQGQQKN